MMGYTHTHTQLFTLILKKRMYVVLLSKPIGLEAQFPFLSPNLTLVYKI